MWFALLTHIHWIAIYPALPSLDTNVLRHSITLQQQKHSVLFFSYCILPGSTCTIIDKKSEALLPRLAHRCRSLSQLVQLVLWASHLQILKFCFPIATHSFPVLFNLVSILKWFSAWKNTEMCCLIMQMRHHWRILMYSSYVVRKAFNIGKVWNPVCCHGNKTLKLILWSTFLMEIGWDVCSSYLIKIQFMFMMSLLSKFTY